MAKYWNKVRKAKKKSYDSEGSSSSNQFHVASATKLFSKSPLRSNNNVQNENNKKDEELSDKDKKLIEFYEHSISKLKVLISKVNITEFEK